MSQSENGHEEHEHASVATYAKVAVLLGVITWIEIAIPYAPNRDPRWLFLTIMVALSLVKFYYVVAIFMHLKYDTKFFSQQFVFAMVIAVGTFVALKFLSPATPPSLASAREAGTALPADWRYDMEAHEAGAAALEMVRDDKAEAAGNGDPRAAAPEAPAAAPPEAAPTETSAEVPATATAMVDPGEAGVAPTGAGPGDPEAGKIVFTNGGCLACHKVASVAGAVGTVGPELDGLMERAGDRVAGMDADAYIRQSIEDPYAYVVDGYLKVMPPVRAQMSDQQFEDLVAFLKTL